MSSNPARAHSRRVNDYGAVMIAFLVDRIEKGHFGNQGLMHLGSTFESAIFAKPHLAWDVGQQVLSDGLLYHGAILCLH